MAIGTAVQKVSWYLNLVLVLPFISISSSFSLFLFVDLYCVITWGLHWLGWVCLITSYGRLLITLLLLWHHFKYWRPLFLISPSSNRNPPLYRLQLYSIFLYYYIWGGIFVGLGMGPWRAVCGNWWGGPTGSTWDLEVGAEFINLTILNIYERSIHVSNWSWRSNLNAG